MGESLVKFHLDRRIFALIITVLYAIPVFYPLGLPLPVTSYTQDFYAVIQELNEGDVVVCAQAQNVMQMDTYRDAFRAVVYAILDRGAKIIFYNFDVTDSPTACRRFLEYIGFGGELGKEYRYPSVVPGKGSMIYGEDIVVFPFLAGEESALAAVRDNMWFFSADVYGNPTDQLPLMQRVHQLYDCKLILMLYTFTTFPVVVIRQWSEPLLRTTGGKTLDGIRYHAIAAWYGTYVFGCLDSVQGYAGFEYLSGYKGEELARIDARNLVWFWVIGTVLAANVYYAYDFLKKRKVTKAGE